MPTTPTKVVFLIDEQPLMKQAITLENLKLSIMRILLFYQSQQEQLEILWSYRFFSTQTRYAANSIRHFSKMTEDSFDAIEGEYKKRDPTQPKISILDSPIMRIKQVLKDAIGDFQWENTDIGTSTPVKNYVYIMTACPSSLKEMNHFFVSPNEDNKPLDLAASSLSAYPPYFQQTKEELTTTLLQSYTQRQIAISIIDTDFKYPLSNPYEQLIGRIIRQGFESCFEQFGGYYILFSKLIRNYNIYGHSFISEFANYLPCGLTPRKVASQIPAWKGPFKTKLGKIIGNFVLFPCLRNGSYLTTTLAFISEIRTISVVHASQFSTSWLLNESAVEPDHDYKFTYEVDESPYIWKTVLDELYATQSILIAELIPINGYEELSKKVSIEPFSRSCASLRYLNIQHLPTTVRLKQVVVDEDHPIGSYITGTNLQIKLPQETPSPSAEHHFELDLDAPTFLKKMLQSRKLDPNKEKGKGAITNSQQQKKEEHVEKVIQLPADVNMMGKALKKLYLELLYTQNDTFENSLVIIDHWVNHLLKSNCTKQEIISNLFDYTMPFEDLDVKHRNEIPQAANKRATGQSTLEQTYLYEWWQHVKTRGSSDSHFEKMSCTVLKLKEARLQVILYCFIARLVLDLPSNTTKRDPFELAEQFFKKTVLAYTMFDITDFLVDNDSEDGPDAIKRRDPADLNDFVFMQLLEKCFKDLPDLTNKFRENVGMDELASSPSSTTSLDNDEQEEPVQYQPQPQPPPPPASQPKETQKIPRPPVIRSLSRHLPTSAQSDNNIRKVQPQSQKTTSSLLSGSSKSLLPVKMQRPSSNKLDAFIKRTVSVVPSNVINTETNRGEATQAAIDKVNRSVVNGRPTMKRTGSFTKSAQSPKRPKRAASMLSHGETGTVILRRETIPNPEVTPRTSLNRYLGTNLFDDYSEPCLSPSSRTTATEELQASRSDYPLVVPKTPQGTAIRYKKVMINHTPHLEKEDDLIGDENEFSVMRSDENNNKPQQHPPYTPRTAARRERDRIDRLQISSHPGRNLTSKFQNMLGEEKLQVKPIVKPGFSIFDDEDDEDEDEDGDGNGDNGDQKNENVNPFRITESSLPVLRRATTDDLFNPSSNIPGLQFGGLNIEEDEDSESDAELPFNTSSRRALFQ